MKHAAGVLITKGPRVLAFRRLDKDGVALPCGMVREGETIAEAAVRKAKEETGLDVRLLTEEEGGAGPFTGFDTVGKTMVTIYRAIIEGGELLEVVNGKGFPVWTSQAEVARGPYWHFNKRLLRHFGIKPPLTGRFHSHITFEAPSHEIAKRAAVLTGGKLTVIDLQSLDKEPDEWLVTHHYMTGSRGLEDHYDIEMKMLAHAKQLHGSGFPVLRTKLELEILDHHSGYHQLVDALDSIYTEVHVKCIVKKELRDNLVAFAREQGWHPSRNPFDQTDDGRVVQFINLRKYGNISLSAFDAEVDRMIPLALEIADYVKEVKYETAVHDTDSGTERSW